MKNKYRQLGKEQRYQIGVLFEIEKCKSKIVDIIGAHKSTIGPEFNRNIGKRAQHAGNYVPRLAQEKTVSRHKLKHKSVKFTDALKEQAADCLRIEQLIPELISVEWKCMDIDGVTLESIYQWIWYFKKSNRKENAIYKYLYRFLQHGRHRFKRGNYKNSRGTIKDRVSIEDRPEIVKNRTRLGNVEVNLMMGKDHKFALVVMTKRTTLITPLDKLEGKDSKVVQHLISKRISRIGSS